MKLKGDDPSQENRLQREKCGSRISAAIPVFEMANAMNQECFSKKKSSEHY